MTKGRAGLRNFDSAAFKLKMTTRIQLNSKTDRIDVYKNTPSSQLNKRYTLKVERFTLPPMSGGLILNQPLFSIERRLLVDELHHTTTEGFEEDSDALDVGLPIDMTFSPSNVNNTSELVFQLNQFFETRILQGIFATQGYADSDAEYGPLAGEFDVAEEEKYNGDWYELRNVAREDDEKGADLDQVSDAIKAVYRSDGTIGIRFNSLGKSMFVLRLTPEGQRIFGWTREFVVVNPTNGFSTEYLTAQPQTPAEILADEQRYNVTCAPNAGTETLICVLPHSLFNHGSYRHEVVLTTSLPLRNYMECDQRSAVYKNQLASYRYPKEPMTTEFNGTLFRTLKNTRQSRYLFEQSTRTHNEFLLTGSELQNFHIRLRQRNYEWDEEREAFEITEIAYPLPPESLWTLQLAVTPL